MGRDIQLCDALNLNVKFDSHVHTVYTLSMEAFEYYYCLKRHLLIFPCGPCNTLQNDHKAYYQSHINILPLFCDFVPAIATFNLKSVSV